VLGNSVRIRVKRVTLRPDGFFKVGMRKIPGIFSHCKHTGYIDRIQTFFKRYSTCTVDLSLNLKELILSSLSYLLQLQKHRSSCKRLLDNLLHGKELLRGRHFTIVKGAEESAPADL
jgi:hypothetical protein